MNFPTCVKLPGTASPNGTTPRKVICFVRYCDGDLYDSLVADSFRDHYRFNIEEWRREHPDQFRYAHNIAFAILIYRHFRPHFEGFSLDSWDYVTTAQLPSREPDASDDDFALWVEPAPDYGPPPEFQLTKL